MHQRIDHLPAQRTSPERSAGATLQEPRSRRSVATYFQRPCPACGRRLMIRVEHLGRQVSCSHCRRAFVASDVTQDPRHGADSGDSMLQRAEELLALLESWNGRPETYSV